MIERFLLNLAADLFLIWLALAFIFFAKKRQGQKAGLAASSRELGFLPISLREFLKKTVLLLAALVAVAIALDFALTAAGMNDTYRVAEAIARMRAVPVLILYLVVVRSIAEEIFFRGLLVKRVGVLLSSVLFAAAHALYGSAAELAGAFLLGLVLAKAFQLNKNLYPNIAAHIAYNAIAIALFYL